MESPPLAPDVQRLDLAMEVGNFAWWEMDCATGCVRFPRRKTDMLGYEPEQFTHYTHFTTLVHAEDLEPVMQAMNDHLAGLRPEYRVDYRIRAKSGAYRWFQDVGRVSLRDEAGVPVTVTGVVLDISDRKRVDRELRESEERFRMLTENAADALWVLDDETERYRYVSPSIVRIGGYSAEEVMNGSVRDSLTAESYAAMRRVRQQRVEEFERGIVRTYIDVVEQTHRNGSHVTIEVCGRFVRNAETGRLEAVGVSRDITQRKLAEEALRAAHERLRRAEQFARFGHWEFWLDDRIMHASEGARQVYGLADSDVALSAIQACALAEYRPHLDEALRRLIEQKAPYDEEFKIHRVSDGAIVHVHSKAEYDPLTKRVFGVVQDVSERMQVEEEREQLITELKVALEQVKTLKGIVPICANCKKIRDDGGYWEQVEAYVSRHTDARFSHGICPDCLELLYPGM